MIKATVAVMSLLLWRDRATLVLVFLLPPLVFVVLTAVFRETGSRVPDVRVAVAHTGEASGGTPLDAALARAEGLSVGRPAADVAELRSRVEDGATEVGVVVGDAQADAPGVPRWTLLVAPGHETAARLVELRVLAALTGGSAQAPPGAGSTYAAPAVSTVGASKGDPVVLDEAGAIAAMFLMLAGIQVAATLVDERESGIHDRVAGSGSTAGLVVGKFAFGVVVGSLQAALIMLTARLAFGVDVGAAPARLGLACVLTAAMATSLTLLVAACCSTRQQAQAISTFGILVVSTLGGSMVPLRLMPPWLERLGRFTPNAWSIDAFRDALTGGAGWHASGVPWAVMTCVSGAALSLAVLAYGRRPVL